MREILFRGKQIDNGEWVYGSYFAEKDKRFDIETNKSIIIGFDKYADIMNNVEVDAETIGQFTGLLDKNGTKIFEGDIVKDTAGGIYKVVYDAEYMRFAFDDGIKWGLEGFESLNDFEVIGNAFDNPKLLEEQ